MDQLYSLLREFDSWQPDNLTDKSAIHLWQTLVRIASKYGLHDWFTVSAETLGVKTRLGRSAIYAARDALRDRGLLEVKSRKGNQSAKYRILPICVRVVDTKPDAIQDTSPDTKPTQARTINDRGMDRRRGIDERVMSRLQGLRAREEGSADLLWAERKITQRQRLHLYVLEAIEADPGKVQRFAQWLADGTYTDAQIGGALNIVRDRFERGKVDYPFDYLHTMLLDWERCGIRTRMDVEEAGYRPVLQGLLEAGEEIGPWKD